MILNLSINRLLIVAWLSVFLLPDLSAQILNKTSYWFGDNWGKLSSKTKPSLGLSFR